MLDPEAIVTHRGVFDFNGRRCGSVRPHARKECGHHYEICSKCGLFPGWMNGLCGRCSTPPAQQKEGR